MALFRAALLICIVTLAFVDQSLSCWGGGGGSKGGGGGGGGSSCPRIVSRYGWNARSPTGTVSMRHPVPRVFIHHTTGSSCYSSSSCAARVRSIQNYHMDNNGWSDIGYNFLVGQDGNVYEGRGWDRQGAHVYGYNDRSIGIAFIGDFSSSKPNSAALNAATKLISCGVSKGKVSSYYTLHGHRDGGSTECPGTALYNEIRTWSRFGGPL